MPSRRLIDWLRRLRQGLSTHSIAGLDSLRGLVLPSICSFCEVDLEEEPGAKVDADRRLCAGCRTTLAQERAHRCVKCAAAVAPTFQGADCPWCRHRDLRFDRAFTLGTYRDELRDAVLRLKHANQESLSTALADISWERNAEAVRAAGADLVVPVPMHWLRRAMQGHNGPDLAASFWAARLQVDDYPRLLVRNRRTRPQAGLSPNERLSNVRNAFGVRRGYRVDGARVLLVDDILTTGATCSEAARILKKAGAKNVAVVVVGRAQGEV
ncbi:MAG: ComF family protein [Planctomycetia bacterium]|nr:ComF family protein [Planctomycetia bacterium]